MRRTFGVLTAALLLIGMAACNQGEGSGGDGGEVTLVFSDWHLTEPHWEDSLKEGIATFEEEHPDINVKLDYVAYDQKETKYQTEMEAGEGPDIVHLHAYSLRSFIQRGYLLSLNEFIEDDGGEEFIGSWYPETLELMQAEDNYFAIPGDFMAMALMYNRDHFQQVGLSEPPTTWDEFLSVAEKLTVDENNDGKPERWAFGTVGALDPGFELRFTPFLFSFGGRYLTEDASCSALDSPEAQEAFDFFTSLFTDHQVIPPGVTSQNAGTVREQLANEEISMKLGSGWTQPIIDSINPKLNAEQVIEAAPVPTAEGVDTEAGTTAWLSAWGINANTENPDEAWELVKFITSQEMEQKWFEDARVSSARMDVSGPDGYEPLLNDKVAGVIAQELERADFVPQIPEWPQVVEAVNTAAQEAFSESTSPSEALQNAHDEINEILGC